MTLNGHWVNKPNSQIIIRPILGIDNLAILRIIVNLLPLK